MSRIRYPVRSALALLALAWIVVAVVRGVTADGATPPPEPSPERVKQVRHLMNVVAEAEHCYFDVHKRFSDNPAELTKFGRDRSEEAYDVGNPVVIAADSDLDLRLWVSDDGQAYTQRIVGEDGIVSTYERDMTNDFADYGQYAWNHVKEKCGAT